MHRAKEFDSSLPVHPMLIVPRRLGSPIACIPILLMGCGQGGDSRQPIAPDRNIVAEHRMNPEQVRQMTGVDRLPQVVDKAAFKAAVERSYPADLRASPTSGSALVDVVIGAEGEVQSVTPVDRPEGMQRSVLILEERDGTERRIASDNHPAFQAAAREAMRSVRFTPAIRDGKAVPFTMRMTVTFDPPAGRER
jgi:hypothetical protein